MLNPVALSTLVATARTLAAGGVGAALAVWLSLPAPFLTGPALAVTLAALAGLRMTMPTRMRDAVFLVIGANMGASVTPEALATAAQWPGSLALLALSITVILLGGAKVMQRAAGMDPMSALLTATPGHLSFVLSLTTDHRADLPRVTLIQSFRVLALTLMVPALAPLLTDRALPTLPASPHVMPVPALAVVLVAGLVVAVLFKRLRVPAATLLAGMAVSALAHALSLTEGRAPTWAAAPAFTAMGALIGTRFSGVTPRMLLQSITAAGLLTGFALLVSFLGALVVAWWFDLPLVTALIAFAPGGIESMIAMAVLLEANPTFVAAHHVWRLVFLTVLLPWAVTRITRAT